MMIAAAEKYRNGEKWIDPASGQESMWDAAEKIWRPTGRYPFGDSPCRRHHDREDDGRRG